MNISCKYIPLHAFSTNGEMPEWSIGAVSKTVVPLRVPRVRIPVSPLISQKYNENHRKTCFFGGFLLF